MAIAKWIPFGIQSVAVASEAAKPQRVQATPADRKQFGLENFGNNCYANSVLQALYFCSPFRELVLQYPDPSLVLPHKPVAGAHASLLSTATTKRKPERKATSESLPINGVIHPPGPLIPSSPPTLFSALRSLFIHISSNPVDKGTVTPRVFIEKLKDVNSEFRNMNHQDAHEFLNFLLNRIVEEIVEDRKHQQEAAPSGEDLSASVGTLFSPTIVTATTSSNSGTSPQDATLVHKLFEGILTSETRCLTCETVSSRDESFLDLSIDIEQNSSVTACLRQFSASEMLCQKNKFFCDSCCDLQEAEKRMKIKKLPNVLALHLKRFKYQEDVQKYIKLAYRVAFPFELRLFNTVDDAPDPDRLYELFAIVVHIGNGPHHGHYVTIIRTPTTWLVFDDETVEVIKESEITKYFGESNSGSAYVLYYQAVDLDLAALGLRPAVPPPLLEPAEAPKPHSFEALAPSSTTVPSLPPGLTDNRDSSDVSDLPPFPVVPSLPVFVDRISHESTSSQPLRLNVPSHDDDIPDFSGPVTGTPGSPGTSAKTGLFQSLRHSPSLKIRGQGSSSGAGLEKRKSMKEKMTRPATSGGLPKPDDPALDPLPLVPTLMQAPVTNDKNIEPDKIKEPERKASIWFKRRGGRADKRPADTPTSPDLGSDMTPRSSSTTAWLRNNAFQMVEPSKSRRPSEPALNDVGAFRSLVSLSPMRSHTPKHSADLSFVPHHGVQDRRSGYDSPSPASATSSFGSSSVQPVDDITPNNTSLPMIPASPQGLSIHHPLNIPSTEMPPSPHSPVDHKRSQPQLRTKKSKDFNSTLSPKLYPRPLTAGASTGGQFEPAPPLPSFPKFARTHRRRASNDHASDTTHSEGRPNSAYVSTEAGLDMTIGQDAPATSSSGNPHKRPSRKLSLSSPILSSPILGFGKKDKGREKEREKTPPYEKVAEHNTKEREKMAKARAKEIEKEERARLKAEAKQNQQTLAPNAFPTFALAS